MIRSITSRSSDVSRHPDASICHHAYVGSLAIVQHRRDWRGALTPGFMCQGTLRERSHLSQEPDKGGWIVFCQLSLAPMLRFAAINDIASNA
jgi:hypothetical protein